MNLTQENINEYLEKYISIIDKISEDKEYDVNIRHLLYLIVPAFICKYGVANEKSILECFKNINVYFTDIKERNVAATFNRILKKDDVGFYTEKYIMLNNYSEAKLSSLIDSIVHEFNHAINSINNEITYDKDYVYVRTGISRITYDKNNLQFVKKSDEVALEEVLNTAQSEEIINIINSFNKFSINNSELANMIYVLNSESGKEGYESEAYQYQKMICNELINNKTFTPTISNLRFKGFIEDIPKLFDDVIGIENSYKKLNRLLTEIHDLIIKYSNRVIFTSRLLNKIKNKSIEVIDLIEDYDKKCIFR